MPFVPFQKKTPAAPVMDPTEPDADDAMSPAPPVATMPPRKPPMVKKKGKKKAAKKANPAIGALAAWRAKNPDGQRYRGK